MRRFVITGAPGAGKTAIIRQLELEGFSVVEEAATDVIAAAHARGTVEPWTHPSFIDAIAGLQRDRQTRASYQPDEVQFHDRCAVCTAALAVYLGHPCSPFLAGELERVKKDAIYENRVFFIRNLGFVAPTEARRPTPTEHPNAGHPKRPTRRPHRTLRAGREAQGTQGVDSEAYTPPQRQRLCPLPPPPGSVIT